MPICSYLVIPVEGRREALLETLRSMDGCDVVPAENRHVLLLVTDTPTPEADQELRARIEALDGVESLLMTFGEVDPATELRDPVRDLDTRRTLDPHAPSTPVEVDPGARPRPEPDPGAAEPDRPESATNLDPPLERPSSAGYDP